MLSAALLLLANSLFLTLRLTGDTGSFPKPLSAGEERMYLERSLAGDLEARNILVGVRLVGLNTYVVLSGSMEPTYHTGSLLYVKSVDPQDLRVGDPITFMLNEDTVATHRIIEILPDEEDSSVLRFRTQGDANDAPDGTPVHYKNVIGKPVFSVPYLGYFANFVQNPPGLYFAIGFAVVLVLLVFLPDLLDDSGKKGKGKGAGEDPTAHN